MSPERSRSEESWRGWRTSSKAQASTLRIGRFGVSIKGEATDFSTILGVETSPNTALSAAIHPTQPELNELIDLVEVAPKPSMY